MSELVDKLESVKSSVEDAIALAVELGNDTLPGDTPVPVGDDPSVPDDGSADVPAEAPVDLTQTPDEAAAEQSQEERIAELAAEQQRLQEEIDALSQPNASPVPGA